MERNELTTNEERSFPVHKPKRYPARIRLVVILGAVFLLSLAFFVYAVNFSANPAARGSSLGTALGVLTGKAVGSYKGVTEGIEEGKKAGEQAGLSAEDTEVNFTGRLQAEGKLEVLEYSGKVNNFFSIGDKQDYAVLYEMDYRAVYTIDLGGKDTEIYEDETGLHITLNKPVVKIIPEEPQMKREYQGKEIDWKLTSVFSAVTGMPIIIKLDAGTTKKGATAYQNEKDALIAKAEERFGEERFQEDAVSAAEKAIKDLVSSLSMSAPRVFIDWK